ncbi:hypothetical protein OSTOST_25262, partial [Ostertagia ostertagi]
MVENGLFSCGSLLRRLPDSKFDVFDAAPVPYGLVRIGSDVTVEELTKHYDAILLAYGAHRPRHLDIPGSGSTNVISGSDFVSWYNGVPN